MRIIQLCTSEGLGGLEQVFEKYTRWFHASEHESLGVVLKNSALQKRLHTEGVPTYELPSKSKKAVLKNALLLARLIEEKEADILHMHLKKDLTTAVLAKLFCKRKFKLVYTRHLHIANSKKDPWHRFFYTRIDLFIAITEQIRQEALHTIPLPDKCIRRLYAGVKAPKAFQEETCKALFADEKLQQPFRVAVFGRIEFNKGQHLVIEAANLLRAKYPDFRFYFFGYPDDQAYFESLQQRVKQEGLTDLVQFKGFHQDPPSIMSCFDVVVLPSFNESFGLVLPEAMRAGVAVVGANSGGVPEIIDHNDSGLLFKKGDANDMAEKLALLYQDKDLRQKLARQGKAKADSHFNEEQHFQDLEKMYLELL